MNRLSLFFLKDQINNELFGIVFRELSMAARIPQRSKKKRTRQIRMDDITTTSQPHPFTRKPNHAFRYDNQFREKRRWWQRYPFEDWKGKAEEELAFERMRTDRFGAERVLDRIRREWHGMASHRNMGYRGGALERWRGVPSLLLHIIA